MSRFRAARACCWTVCHSVSRAGEMVALVGPNGVGKTTLLRLASRLLAADSGDVLLEGKPLAAWSRQELPRAVALVPQELQIPFNFSVEEIVAPGSCALSTAVWRQLRRPMPRPSSTPWKPST